MANLLNKKGSNVKMLPFFSIQFTFIYVAEPAHP